MTAPLTYCFQYLILLPNWSCEQLIDGQWIQIAPDSERYSQYCKPAYFCQNKDTIKW